MTKVMFGILDRALIYAVNIVKSIIRLKTIDCALLDFEVTTDKKK
jgi:hypothetical protein